MFFVAGSGVVGLEGLAIQTPGTILALNEFSSLFVNLRRDWFQCENGGVFANVSPTSIAPQCRKCNLGSTLSIMGSHCP